MPACDVNGRSLHWRVHGRGPSVVMLHCSGSSGAQWDGWSDRLGGGFQVVAPDLFGCGASTPWSGVTLDEQARGIAAVLDQLHGPVHLVGHSMGGAVALATALKREWRLASLTLIEPVTFHLLAQGCPAVRALDQEVGALAGAIARSVEEGVPEAGMARFVDYWNGPGSWLHLSPEAQARLARRAAVVADDFRALAAVDTPLSRYRQLGVPTRIISGALAPAPVRWLARTLSRALGDAPHTVIADAGHMAPMTHPDTVAAVIARHVSECFALPDVAVG